MTTIVTTLGNTEGTKVVYHSTSKEKAFNMICNAEAMAKHLEFTGKMDEANTLKCRIEGMKDIAALL